MHESVVSRPTFSRSVQLELSTLPDGMRAKLPSTIGAAGELITNAVHPAIQQMKLSQSVAEGEGSNEYLAPGASGSFVDGALNYLFSAQYCTMLLPSYSCISIYDLFGYADCLMGCLTDGEMPTGLPIGSSRGRGNKVNEIDVLGDRSSTASRVKTSNVGFVQNPSGERGSTAQTERGHSVSAVSHNPLLNYAAYHFYCYCC